MILFEFRLAMMIDEDEQLPSCAKTLGFMLNPEFEAHWLFLLFHWQQPMRTFRSLPQNAEFSLMIPNITKMPCADFSLTH